MTFPEQFRLPCIGGHYESHTGDPFGAFVIPPRAARGRALAVIASEGFGPVTAWDHVSVSIIERPDKTPSWEEMCLVKALFWEPHECVVQFHPPEADYVNVHPGVLHLWRDTSAPFPMPPKMCV